MVAPGNNVTLDCEIHSNNNAWRGTGANYNTFTKQVMTDGALNAEDQMDPSTQATWVIQDLRCVNRMCDTPVGLVAPYFLSAATAPGVDQLAAW